MHLKNALRLPQVPDFYDALIIPRDQDLLINKLNPVDRIFMGFLYLMRDFTLRINEAYPSIFRTCGEYYMSRCLHVPEGLKWQ